MNAPLTDEQKIIHFLNRVTFGPTPAETDRIKNTGIFPYLEEQLHPEKIPDPAAEEKLAQLKTVRLSSRELLELYPPPKQAKSRGMDISPMQTPRFVIFELQQAKLLRAVYSRRQLYELMVDFWTNHFNVFAGKGADRWLVTSYDRDTIRPNTLGKFYDLLLADAKSPAMLFYLDNFQSVSANAQGQRPNQTGQTRPGAARDPLIELMRGRNPNRNPNLSMSNNPQQQRPQQQQQRRGINENYARELMELHTLGVDGGYTQKDVQEVARCFTGWTIIAPRGAGA